MKSGQRSWGRSDARFAAIAVQCAIMARRNTDPLQSVAPRKLICSRRRPNQCLRDHPPSVQTSRMQHEAFANTEDFGGPDIVAGPGRVSRPGVDIPYANYELGKPYDEMFTREGGARLPYAAMDSRLSTVPLEELNRRQQAC